MDIHDLRNLEVGDIVLNKATKSDYVVTGNYGDHVTAVRTVDITNAPEWRLLSKANRNATK